MTALRPLDKFGEFVMHNLRDRGPSSVDGPGGLPTIWTKDQGVAAGER